MADPKTTGGQSIKHGSPDFVTIYAPDGKEHICSPVDAREILASGAGYTSHVALPAVESNESQSSEPQQYAHPNVEDVKAQTGDEIIQDAFSAIKTKGKQKK